MDPTLEEVNVEHWFVQHLESNCFGFLSFIYQLNGLQKTNTTTITIMFGTFI